MGSFEIEEVGLEDQVREDEVDVEGAVVHEVEQQEVLDVRVRLEAVLERAHWVLGNYSGTAGSPGTSRSSGPLQSTPSRAGSPRECVGCPPPLPLPRPHFPLIWVTPLGKTRAA